MDIDTLYDLYILLFVEFSFRWIVDLDGAPGTLYAGEKMQLLFKFGSRYPFDSPQVSTGYTRTLFISLEVYYSCKKN